ncbi:MAG: UDP-N-acetylmuramate dehydrogenase, partial [Acidimicrobiales bacterium]
SSPWPTSCWGLALSSEPGGSIEAVAGRLGPLCRRDVPIGPLTTYRVGGRAAIFVEARTVGDLETVRDALSGGEVPVLVIGKGSNLLVSDSGFRGLAVTLATSSPSDFCDLAIEDTGDAAVLARAGGALPMAVLARRCVEAGALGLEWAVGVPGSLGGAVRMNAGGHGCDIAGCLVSYIWMDLLSPAQGEGGLAELAPSYRRTSIGEGQVVLGAELGALRGDPGQGRARLSQIVRWRREHQPGGSNAGSVFTNPAQASAGALIEAAGAKGLREGTAVVSHKHANFIQADRGGSADDVARLMGRVAALVYQSHGVELTPEVVMVGFGDKFADRFDDTEAQ